MPLHIETPLLHSAPLSRLTGKQVWLKMEAMQPSGSFKMRGIGAVCEGYARAGKRRLISSSGGNAGIAAAHAGRLLGLAVTVVVPQSATVRARELIAEQGAEVMVHGATWHEAHALAQSMLDEYSAFVHPFDDPVAWQGHATLVDEVVAAGVDFDAVVLTVGGGGLLCGVVAGLRHHGLTQLPVVAVETLGADSLHQSVQAGQRVELPSITSIATTLGARQVCAQAFELTRVHPIITAVVDDAQAVQACFDFMRDHNTLIEPACGAGLVMLYGQNPALQRFERPLIVVCGGSTATWPQLERWREELPAS